MDWLDLLAVQGTLKSLLQHHSSKASILRRSAFFTVQLSHPYVTTGKTIALTRRTFVGKVMSLLLNMRCRLVITFLPRSQRLLISWLRISKNKGHALKISLRCCFLIAVTVYWELNICFIHVILLRSFKEHTGGGCCHLHLLLGKQQLPAVRCLACSSVATKGQSCFQRGVSGANVHALSPDVGPERKVIGRVAR